MLKWIATVVICLLLTLPAYAAEIDNLTAKAQTGDAAAQAKLGDAYFFGEVTQQDFAKAMEWYTKAAEQNNAEGLEGVGRMYFNGSGVEKDMNKAAEWLNKAAERGSMNAMMVLGYMYLDETSPLKDHYKSYMWLQKTMHHPDINNAGNEGIRDTAAVMLSLSQQDISKEELARAKKELKAQGIEIN